MVPEEEVVVVVAMLEEELVVKVGLLMAMEEGPVMRIEEETEWGWIASRKNNCSN